MAFGDQSWYDQMTRERAMQKAEFGYEPTTYGDVRINRPLPPEPGFEVEMKDYNPKAGFITKDSGERAQYASGMQRDTTTGKIRPDLIKDGPMYLRWVMLMTRGAVKYDARNWMKADGQEEYDRFLESTDRHYQCWYWWRMYGLNIERLEEGIITEEPLTEDHAAAVFFNINSTEYLADKRGHL